MARLLRPTDCHGPTTLEMLSAFRSEVDAYLDIRNGGGLPGIDNRILDNWIMNRQMAIAELEAKEIQVRH